MPFEDFDPRADEDLDPIAEQSPKLLALAEQLSEDASALAKRYPASFVGLGNVTAVDAGSTKPQNQPSKLVREFLLHKRTLVRGSLIAGASAAAVLCAIMVFESMSTRLDREDNVAATTTIVLADEDLVQMADKNHRTDRSPNEGLTPPADFLKRLSAAEQEALLDLLEGSAGLKESVSI